MIRRLHILVIFFALLASASVFAPKASAQQPGFVNSAPVIAPVEKAERNILSDLAAVKAGQGIVRIHQSNAIKALIKVRSSSSINLLDDEALFTTMPGYKVQIYSSNARDSRSIANSRSAQVKQLYPELESVILYNAPFWKVQIGNFVNRQEAQEVLKNIKKQFPSFGKQSFIVRTTIKVPI